MRTISLFSVNSEALLPLLERLIGQVTYPILGCLKREVFLIVGTQNFHLQTIPIPTYNATEFSRFIIRFDDLVTGLEEGGTLNVMADFPDSDHIGTLVVRNLRFSKLMKE